MSTHRTGTRWDAGLLRSSEDPTPASFKGDLLRNPPLDEALPTVMVAAGRGVSIGFPSGLQPLPSGPQGNVGIPEHVGSRVQTRG